MRSSTSTKKLSRTDKFRVYLYRKGVSVDDIATQTGCNLVQVQDSLQRYEMARAEVSNEEVDMAINQTVLKSMEATQKVFSEALKANHIDITYDKKNQMKKQIRPDHATRLKAVDTMKNLMDSVRPKGGGITVNANTQVNNGNVNSPNAPRAFDFESRLRDIRKRKGLDINEHVIDGEVVDEEHDELADELSELGIEIEDDEEDEE